MNQDKKIAFLLFPFLGIWLFLFYKKDKKPCQAFILHGLAIIYFAISMIVLKFSIWITPYFLEPVIGYLIDLNILLSLFSFLLPVYLFITDSTDNFFDRWVILDDLKNYLFK